MRKVLVITLAVGLTAFTGGAAVAGPICVSLLGNPATCQTAPAVTANVTVLGNWAMANAAVDVNGDGVPEASLGDTGYIVGLASGTEFVRVDANNRQIVKVANSERSVPWAEKFYICILTSCSGDNGYEFYPTIWLLRIFINGRCTGVRPFSLLIGPC